MGLVSLFFCLIFWVFLVGSVNGIGANWGIQATHTLPPDVVVRMLRENGIQKVKLFDADYSTMKALGNSNIQVMVGIPNDKLATLASGMKQAENWVKQNVSAYISKNAVNIRYVAVGNEPFLTTYNGSFLQTTFPALQNIQSALIKAGLANQVKVTIPLNADVYQSPDNLPSNGDFRADIRDLMLAIVKFLSDNGGAFTVNIYPFISLYNDPAFPFDYAFFDGSYTVIDNGRTYTNVFDANHDMLVWTLQKNGYGSLPIIVGEAGWPSDGDYRATLKNAQRFNQGFMNHILTQNGTPMRTGQIDAYLFSLIDEDAKSIAPGNFERHWGVFYYDGQPKYSLNLGTTSNGQLVAAKNVKYQEQRWCVLSPKMSIDDPQVAGSVSYACALGDCTPLGYQTSCGGLDTRGNISYAFNSYYQITDQLDTSCKFGNLSIVTKTNPSAGTCIFPIEIEPWYSGGTGWRNLIFGQGVVSLLVCFFVCLLTFL